MAVRQFDVADRDIMQARRDQGLPRHTPRRAAILREAGRVISVIVPVGIVVLTLLEASSGWRLAVAAELCVVWIASMAIGQSLGGVALTALGPRIGPARGSLIGLVAVTAMGSWLPWPHLSTGATFILAAVIFATGASWEGIALRYVTPAKRLLIVGSGPSVSDLTRDIRMGHGGGYEAIGVVHDGPEASQYTGVPVLGRVSELTKSRCGAAPDLVALAPGCNRPETFTQLLESAASGFRVLELAQFYEHAFGRVPVRDLTRAWFMSVLHLYQRPYARYTKRTSDIVGALILLVIAVPLFPMLALLVRCTKGPVLLRQTRVGEHGELFMMYKFRTMRVDAEAPGDAVWATRDDPRVTSVGAHHEAVPPRRAAADLERPDRRHVDRRPAPRAARVHRPAPRVGPVLGAPAPRQAGHHRLGAGQARLHGRHQGQPREALVRPLVHPPPQPDRRHRDLRSDTCGVLRGDRRARRAVKLDTLFAVESPPPVELEQA